MYRRDPAIQEPLSVILGEKCRINSFTFLELAEAQGKKNQSKDNLSVLSNNRDKQVLFQKIQEVDLDKSIKYITQDTDTWRMDK